MIEVVGAIAKSMSGQTGVESAQGWRVRVPFTLSEFSIPVKRASHRAKCILFLSNTALEHKPAVSSSTQPVYHNLQYCFMKMEQAGHSRQTACLRQPATF